MMRQALNALLTATVLTACAGTPFDWDDARKIDVGMTEQQVTALMGKPYLVKSQNGQLIWVWTYVDTFMGTRTVSVIFKDGVVSEAPPVPSSFK